MKIKSTVYAIIMAFVRPLCLIWCFVAAIFRLLANAKCLYSADNIVLQWEGGFGHMFHNPDIMRLMYPGQKNVYLFAYWSHRHNPYVADIWQNPKFILIRASFDPPKIGQTVWVPGTKVLFKFIQWLLERLTPCQNILSVRDLYQAAIEIRRPDIAFDKMFFPKDSNLLTTYNCDVGYNDLLAKETAPQLRLPEKFQQSIEYEFRKITNGHPGQINKCCGLYLREKGGAADSSLRTGSPLNDYLPAVHRLVAAGYRVLVYGDRIIPQSVLNEFKGALIDTAQTSIDPQLAMIFAATECDIFIGDAGGGCYLPIANRIPALIFNVFPYFCGIANATNHFKTLKTTSGELVPFQQLFGRYAGDRDLQGLTLEANSAEEIEEAVAQFIEGHSNDQPYGVHFDDIASGLPDYILGNIPTVRISPVWLKKYNIENASISDSLSVDVPDASA